MYGPLRQFLGSRSRLAQSEARLLRSGRPAVKGVVSARVAACFKQSCASEITKELLINFNDAGGQCRALPSRTAVGGTAAALYTRNKTGPHVLHGASKTAEYPTITAATGWDCASCRRKKKHVSQRAAIEANNRPVCGQTWPNRRGSGISESSPLSWGSGSCSHCCPGRAQTRPGRALRDAVSDLTLVRSAERSDARLASMW